MFQLQCEKLREVKTHTTVSNDTKGIQQKNKIRLFIVKSDQCYFNRNRITPIFEKQFIFPDNFFDDRDSPFTLYVKVRFQQSY